jgi:hypothetical protein
MLYISVLPSTKNVQMARSTEPLERRQYAVEDTDSEAVTSRYILLCTSGYGICEILSRPKMLGTPTPSLMQQSSQNCHQYKMDRTRQAKNPFSSCSVPCLLPPPFPQCQNDAQGKHPLQLPVPLIP